MSTRRALSLFVITCLASFCTPPALAVPFTPALDEFWIVKNLAGTAPTEIFRDSFSDGVPPPSGPDDNVLNPLTYSTFGQAGFTGESGSRLTMTPALGGATIITGTYTDTTTSAFRLLSTNTNNPTTAANFLGIDSAFSIHGLFDLTSLPSLTGQSFGIRATDQSQLGNPADNTYTLFVGLGTQGGPNAGEVVVAIRLNDYVTNVSTVLDAVSIQSLLPGASQIELVLSKALDASVLTASYMLYDADHNLLYAGEVGTNAALSIYQGETFIRGGFQATDRVPVPEPATVALLGLGFASLSFVRKRKNHD